MDYAQGLDFSAIYAAHFRYVWQTLRRLGVRQADAADRTQAVFIVVYRKLSYFEARSAVKSWLFGICRHVASTYRRGLKRRWRREVAVEPRALARYPDRAQDAAEARDGVAQAATILRKLPLSQSQVLLLFEVEELRGPEIAELLGISASTVRSRLRSARKLFQGHAQRLQRCQGACRLRQAGT